MDTSVNIYRILKIIAAHKKVYLYSLLIVPVLTYFATFLLTTEYQADTKVLILDSGPSGIISSISSEIPLLGSIFSKSENANKIVGISQSRSVMDTVINKFHLGRYYKTKFIEETYETFMEYNPVTYDEETGIITITGRYSSPDTAKMIADLYRDAINHTYLKIAKQNATELMKYLGKNVEEAQQKFDSTLQAIKAYKDENDLYEIKQQMELSLSNIGDIINLKLENDLKAKFLERSGLKDQSLKNTLLKKDVIKSILDDLYNNGAENGIIIPLKDINKMELEYTKLYQNKIILQKILEFLIPAYENAKMESVKSTPVFEVIDYANVPERKVFPVRRNIMMIVFIIYFIFLTFYYITLENMELHKSGNTEIYKKFVELKMLWNGKKRS